MMFWKFIREKLNNEIEVILLTVVESKGSSPGRAGFKMVVSKDGDWQGSVGGGIMEYELTNLAREMLHDSRGGLLKRLVHGGKEGSDRSGLICAGSQQVAMIPVKIKDLSLIEMILEKKRGRLTLSKDGLDFEPDDSENLQFGIEFNEDENWWYRESLGVHPQLYIFGGGHVSLALSKMFRLLGFWITVLDNRSRELQTMAENEFADEIRIIDYGEAEDHVPEGDNIYVVIMTSGHESDGLVLEQMISKKIRYLGMMGSSQKIRYIYDTLKKTGLSDNDFEHIDAPIGMDINSETPMEIAVSIAAGVIRVKNSK